MLTRKDFQATADILHERVKDSLVRVDGVAIPGLCKPGLCKPGHSHGLIFDMVRVMSQQFADNFAASNPRFDREKFMRAVFH